MLSFKEFIVNSHDRNAKEYIINSHGSHSIPLSEKQSAGKSSSFSSYSGTNFNPGLGKTPEDHISMLNKVHPLSAHDSDHLSKWSSSSSNLTDSFLRAHKEGQPLKTGVHWGHDVEHLDKSTNNKLKVGAIVHSGISFDPAKTDDHIVSHLSTSTDPEVAHNFAIRSPRVDENTGETVHRMLRIHLKKGDPAAVIGSAKHPTTGKPISEYHNEHEVLLGRTEATGKKLKINQTPEVYRDSENRLIHVHHAELED